MSARPRRWDAFLGAAVVAAQAVLVVASAPYGGALRSSWTIGAQASAHKSKEDSMDNPRRSWRILHTRRMALVVAVALIAVAATAIVASAVTLTPKSGHNLVAVGPISGENGFPESYTDDTGTRLELC